MEENERLIRTPNGVFLFSQAVVVYTSGIVVDKDYLHGVVSASKLLVSSPSQYAVADSPLAVVKFLSSCARIRVLGVQFHSYCRT